MLLLARSITARDAPHAAAPDVERDGGLLGLTVAKGQMPAVALGTISPPLLVVTSQMMVWLRRVEGPLPESRRAWRWPPSPARSQRNSHRRPCATIESQPQTLPQTLTLRRAPDGGAILAETLTDKLRNFGVQGRQSFGNRLIVVPEPLGNIQGHLAKRPSQKRRCFCPFRPVHIVHCPTFHLLCTQGNLLDTASKGTMRPWSSGDI